MKYFSMSDWQEWSVDAKNVRAYQSYINSVRAFLPADLQLLAGAGGHLSLNDGEIESLQVLSKTSLVNITINGKCVRGTVVGARIFHLVYSGVISLISIVDSNAEGFQGRGYGDHGFDEVEIIENNIYEHRMLFSSGIELHIRFHDFSLEYRDE